MHSGNRITAVSGLVNPGVSSSITYDQLNRLAGVNYNNAGVAVNMSYDRYGNRWNQTYTQGSGSNQSFTFDQTTNRNTFVGGYDAVGNMVTDGIHSYTYDAEGNVVQVDGGSTATYTYDAQNRRVQVQEGSTNTLYAFDIDGHRAMTFDGGSLALTRTNAYWGRRLLATYVNNQI